MSRSSSSNTPPWSLPLLPSLLPSMPIIHRVLQQTREETSRLAQLFRRATVDSWEEHCQQQHQQQQRHHHHHHQAYAAGVTQTTSSSRATSHHQQPNGYLQYFGIPTEDHHHDRHPYYDDPTRSAEGAAGNDAADFVLLPPSQGRGHEWGAAPNLDVFLSSLYQYYYHRGWIPILLKGVVELVGLFFTLALSVFLFAFVDWHALTDCTNESTCRPTLSAYLVEHPLHVGTLWGTLVVVYALLFGAYGMVALATFVHSLREASAAQWVFEERLGINARKLQGGAVDWDRDVVSRLVQLQHTGEYRIAIHHGHDNLDALIIAQRILRKENFLIALLNANVLDLTVPGWKGRTFLCSSIEASWLFRFSSGRCHPTSWTSCFFLSPVVHSPLSFSLSPIFCFVLIVVVMCAKNAIYTQWVLHFAVLNFMFNHKYQVRPAFYLDPTSLRRRLVLCGIAHAVFLPFLLFFITLHFGFQNAYDWKSTKRYLGPREWSWYAKWQFREFNELLHHFEHRLGPSYQAAEEYLKLFGHSDVLKALGRVVVFVSGSLGAVLFVLAAMNDAILLHVKIADWNLLWYAGMVGVAYSIGKAMLPIEESVVPGKVVRNLYADADAALLRLATHTHSYPEVWKNRGADPATYQAVSSMFQYKAKLFAMEVLSVMVAPVVLCVSLANCAERICEFVLLTKEEITGAGEVCGFATFDFDKFSDLAWEGKTLGRTVLTGQQQQQQQQQSTLVESLLRTGDVERATADLPRPKTRHGKMEKSFFSFKVRWTAILCPFWVVLFFTSKTHMFLPRQRTRAGSACRPVRTWWTV